MKKHFKKLSASVLLIPSILGLWFVINHLLNLYAFKGPYSFGLHLKYGSMKFQDPWSDVIVLFCVFAATACGIAVTFSTRKAAYLWSIGLTMMVIAALGIAGAF